MGNIKISVATVEDRPQLVKLLENYKDQELVESRVNFYTTNKFTVVAKDQDKIIGMVQWCPKENPQAGVAELEELFVLKEFRNKGLGSELMGYVLELTKKYFQERNVKPRKFYLFVSQDNSIAKNLYEKFGFKFSGGTFPGLFSDNETELLYWLDL